MIALDAYNGTYIPLSREEMIMEELDERKQQIETLAKFCGLDYSSKSGGFLKDGVVYVWNPFENPSDGEQLENRLIELGYDAITAVRIVNTGYKQGTVFGWDYRIRIHQADIPFEAWDLDLKAARCLAALQLPEREEK